jgi:hypothetical protein
MDTILLNSRLKAMLSLIDKTILKAKSIGEKQVWCALTTSREFNSKLLSELNSLYTGADGYEIILDYSIIIKW